MLSALNKRLMSRGGLQRHAAVVYGVFDPHTLEMHLASAGMPGPLYFSAKGCTVLDLSGVPPGLFADSEYETFTLKLAPGDSILVCSDGIIEAQNARYDDFGIDRLMSVCNANSTASPTELLGCIFLAVPEFTDVIRQHDDMAAVIFHLADQRMLKHPTSRTTVMPAQQQSLFN